MATDQLPIDELDVIADAHRWDTRDGRIAMMRAAIAADRARAVPVYMATDDMRTAAWPTEIIESWPAHNRARFTIPLYTRPPAPEQPTDEDDQRDLNLLWAVYEHARSMLRYEGVDAEKADRAVENLRAAIDAVVFRETSEPADLSIQAAGEREDAETDTGCVRVFEPAAPAMPSIVRQNPEAAWAYGWQQGWRAARASLSTPASGEGWKLVPVEATKAMRVAAVKSLNGDAVYKNVAAAALEIEEAIYGEVFEAMLAAAPTSPTEPAAATWCWSWDEETFHGQADTRDAAAAEVSDEGGWIAQIREPREFISATQLGRTIYEHVSECLGDEIGEAAGDFVMKPADEERIGKAVLDMIANNPGFCCWGVKAVECVEPTEPAAAMGGE